MEKTTAEQEVSLCYHIICLVLNYFAVLHDQNSKFDWFTFQRYGGKWKYMSHLLLYAVTFYIVYAIIVDIINIMTGQSGRPGDDDKESVAVHIRDSTFNDVLQPFCLGHSLLFVFTSLFNHGFFVSVINRRKETLLSYHMMYLHMFPFIFCLLESALVYHKPSKKDSFKIPLILALLYNCWVLWVAYFGTYWSYPFLRRASTIVKVLCLALLPVIITGCHFMGTKVSNCVWGSDEVAVVAGAKEKSD